MGAFPAVWVGLALACLSCRCSMWGTQLQTLAHSVQVKERRRAPDSPKRLCILVAWGAWKAHSHTRCALRLLRCSSSSQHALIDTGVTHQPACLLGLQSLVLRRQRPPSSGRLLAIAEAGRKSL